MVFLSLPLSPSSTLASSAILSSIVYISFSMLKWLPLALSDLAIGSHYGIRLAPCLNCFLFSFHIMLPMLQDSRLVTELELYISLAVQTHCPYFFVPRTFIPCGNV